MCYNGIFLRSQKTQKIGILTFKPHLQTFSIVIFYENCSSKLDKGSGPTLLMTFAENMNGVSTELLSRY